MQFIFDNLIAVMVSASLAVILLTQQTSTRQDAIERQSVYSAKVQSLGFAEWLERDIVKLGARFGEDRNRFTPTAPVVRNGVSFTTGFEFAYNERENNDGTVDRVQIRYTLVRTDSSLVARAAGAAPARYVALYRLNRAERTGRWKKNVGWVGADGTAAPTPAYVPDPTRGSPAGLSHFYIEPRTSNGAALPPARAAEADYIHVQFSVLPTLFPVHKARFVRETGLSWASTFEIRPF